MNTYTNVLDFTRRDSGKNRPLERRLRAVPKSNEHDAITIGSDATLPAVIRERVACADKQSR
jgi:hypothetical protein